MQKPKLLIALSRFPYPVTDGTRYRILRNISDALAADFDIEYLVVTTETVAKEDIAHVEACYGKVHLFRISSLGFFARSLQSLWNGLPFQSSAFRYRPAVEWLQKHMGEYKAAYVHTIRMAEYFRCLPASKRAQVLMDFNDAISLNYQGAKSRAPFPLSLVYRIEERRVRAYEKKCMQAFPHSSVISPYDREYLLGLLPEAERSRTDLQCMPYGIERGEAAATSPGHAIYFIGQLDYEMNRDALVFLLDRVWPRLRAAIPDMELHVVGGTRKKTYMRYMDWEGVHFDGFIADATAIIQKCVCLVAPIRTGAGVPSKIIQALSFGMPVVTTPLGARGLGNVKNGENMLIVGESIDEWVHAIVSLVEDQALCARIGENARMLFEREYALPQVQAQWREAFKRLAA